MTLFLIKMALHFIFTNELPKMIVNLEENHTLYTKDFYLVSLVLHQVSQWTSWRSCFAKGLKAQTPRNGLTWTQPIINQAKIVNPNWKLKKKKKFKTNPKL